MTCTRRAKLSLTACSAALLLCGSALAQAPATPAPRIQDGPPGPQRPAAAAPPAQTQTPALPNPQGAAAPNDAAAKAAAAAKANVDVTDGWTRATPGNATTAAIYLRIVNVGKEPDRLIGADAGASQKAELHTGTMANGVMKMDAVPAMVIPAGGTVTFSPAGNHIMLTGLKAPLKEGESFLVTLDFEKAGKETAVVKILAVNAMGPPPPAKAGNPRDVTSGATQPPPGR